MCCGVLRCARCGESLMYGSGEIVMTEKGMFHKVCSEKEDVPKQSCCGD